MFLSGWASEINFRGHLPFLHQPAVPAVPVELVSLWLPLSHTYLTPSYVLYFCSEVNCLSLPIPIIPSP